MQNIEINFGGFVHWRLSRGTNEHDIWACRV